MTNPLFVADLDTLKEKLRLSGLAEDGDAHAIFDEALLEVRVHFYRRLGASLVTSLLATGFTENPTTNATALRGLANVTEVNWVRLVLLCRLPQLWMDNSGQAQKAWNEEAPYRERGDKTATEKERLEKTIEDALDLLLSDEVFGSEEGIRSFDGSPLCDGPAPGASVGRNLSNIAPPNPLFED